ncbi:hypothetical protein B0T26DRAFT_822195 [Lasiosphaeria miniovina]|uniref:F-box domain-containing protein n=1 Tax=Lasiosphaeria miniovina TaxID=1954250 RepID=A0AA40E790_9PEZI|nr:uncharacterized protein B0T26DRAFT_822195 [Lasiosphaeria miniovina]KAK0727642.1 hypothetical protein B0T26DRAFT_822195 [Lasiosphaeria miniovina]
MDSENAPTPQDIIDIGLDDDSPSLPIDPQSASPLVRIPLEVLVRVTRHVSTTDLGNLRLSCKAVERSLWNFFSLEFFRKKQFMVFPASLQALVDISKHPQLSSVLSHVIIATDRLRDSVPMSVRGGETGRFLEDALAGHYALISTGLLKDMLADAFRNLPNLDKVDIRDFNSPTRTRDGSGAFWRSYGSVTIEAAMTRPMMHHTDEPCRHQDYPSQIFIATLAALAAAKARPRAIETLLRWTEWGLDNTAFYISPYIEPSLKPVLAGLSVLHLCPTFDGHSATSYLLQRFLTLTPNLTWLRLNFQHKNERAVGFLDWLGSSASPNTSGEITASNGSIATCPPIKLEFLEVIDLGSLQTTADAVLKLVAKFVSSLTGLSFRRVTLIGRTSNNKPDEVSPWTAFLEGLASLDGANLRKLQMSVVDQCTQTRMPVIPVFFESSQMKARDRVFKTSLTAELVAAALEEMGRGTKWPGPIAAAAKSNRNTVGNGHDGVNSDDDADGSDSDEEMLLEA